jgi:hypothetical protein
VTLLPTISFAQDFTQTEFAEAFVERASENVCGDNLRYAARDEDSARSLMSGKSCSKKYRLGIQR